MNENQIKFCSFLKPKILQSKSVPDLENGSLPSETNTGQIIEEKEPINEINTNSDIDPFNNLFIDQEKSISKQSNFNSPLAETNKGPLSVENPVQLSFGSGSLDSESSSDELDELKFLNDQKIHKNSEARQESASAKYGIAPTLASFSVSSSFFRNNTRENESVLTGKRKFTTYGKQRDTTATENDQVSNISSEINTTVIQGHSKSGSSFYSNSNINIQPGKVGSKKLKTDTPEGLISTDPSSSKRSYSMAKGILDNNPENSDTNMSIFKTTSSINKIHILQPTDNSKESEFLYSGGPPSDNRLYSGQQWPNEDADPNAAPFKATSRTKNTTSSNPSDNSKPKYQYKKFAPNNFYQNDIDTSFNIGIVDSSESYLTLLNAKKNSLAAIETEFKLSDFYSKSDSNPYSSILNPEIQSITNDKMKQIKAALLDKPEIDKTIAQEGSIADIIESGNYYSASTFSGKSLYFPIRDSSTESSSKTLIFADNVGWLNPRINQIVSKLEAEILGNTNTLKTKKLLGSNSKNQENEVPKRFENSGMLWVDKYKPSNFLELVGNDKVNRTVLQWVKNWDYCVFGKHSAAKNKNEQAMNTSRKDKFSGSRMSLQSQPDFNKIKDNTYDDKLKRPFKKILLLSGPPGIGKTTLVNIMTKQAGYKPLEINASDLRTSAHLKNLLDAATGTQSIGEGVSPQALIIDEIDGVSMSRSKDDESFVSILVKLCRDDMEHSSMLRKQKGGDQRDGFTNREAKKKERKILKRPIICICNDLYTRALHPLREVAAVIQLGPPSADKITKHLSYICQSENVEPDDHTLSILAKISQGDIRTCINFLQIICTNKKSLKSTSLDSLLSSKKDSAPSIFEAWRAIFAEINHAQHKKLFNSTFDRSKSGHIYMKYLLDLLRGSGEYDKIMQGCFENYLKMNTRDPTLNRFIGLTDDWLAYYDQLGTRISENPNNSFALLSYLPYTFVAFNSTCKNHLGIDNGNFTFPKAESNAMKKKREFELTAQHFLSNMSITETKSPRSITTFSTYFHSYLLRIISPNLVVANLTLYNNSMKKTLNHLVTVMSIMGFKFVQNRTDDGQYKFDLSPPLDKMIQFNGGSLRYIIPIKYQVRMLVSQQIEQTKMRVHPDKYANTENLHGKSVQAKNMAATKLSSEAAISSKGLKNEKENKPSTKSADELNNSDVLESKSVKRTSNLKEFFKAKQVAKSISQTVLKSKNGESRIDQGNEEPGLPEGDKSKTHKIWYHFNDGFSNAVKKPAIIKDFL